MKSTASEPGLRKQLDYGGRAFRKNFGQICAAISKTKNSLRSRCLEVLNWRKKERTREGDIREGRGSACLVAQENHFNSLSGSADIPNWSRVLLR